VIRKHTIRCGSCKLTHPTAAGVRRCYDEAAFDAAESAAELYAENAWLRAAEAGTPETWAEEDHERMLEAMYG
jgi:hypothetical protein